MELQFEFEITERPIAGEESAPGYEAVHLLSEMGPHEPAQLLLIPASRRRPTATDDDKDTLSIDYAAASKLTWTYHRPPATVVVKDQPRA